MTRIPVAIALSIVALLAAACSASGGSPAPNAADLPGTAWTVTTIGGQATEAATPPTMAFGADGVVNGTTGCNNYNGSYKLDGAKITIGPLAMTMMMCQGAVAAQETVFSAALQKATGWSIGGDGNLTLTGSADIVAKPAGGS